MFCFESCWTNFFAISIALITITITYFKWSFSYWKRRNIPYLEPKIPFGNLENPFTATESTGVVIKRIYDGLKKRNCSHGGIFFFTMPLYFVLDLDYVKNILTRDFQHFTDRGSYYNEKDEPIGANLFTIGGIKWRNLRTKLTPTFTSGKLKTMFQSILDCESNLQEKIQSLSNQPVDIKELLGCFTTDVIGSCAFGLECNTFKDDDSLFRKYGKRAFSPTRFEQMKVAFAVSFPKLALALRVRLLPKEMSDFFHKIVTDNVKYREENDCTRKDFMQLLIDLKNNKLAEEEGYKHDGKTLTVDEIIAQSFIFFFAGFETTASTMTFALYELSKNQEIQAKVRDEIGKVLKKHDGKISYEAIQEMTYMNQVLNETLRKYPPVLLISRECVKDYKIPDQNIIIKKGMKVIVSILGIHYDKEYYPDPEKFDPERFSEESSTSRPQYAFLPFGEGPRICIGARFGILESKIALTSLLRRYKFLVNKKTKEPLTFTTRSFVLSAEGGIWLDVQKL